VLLPRAASFFLANFAIPCSAIGWLLHPAPRLLNFASTCSLLPPCYLLPSLLHHWLVVVSCTAAPPLLLWHTFPCYLCYSPLNCYLVVASHAAAPPLSSAATHLPLAIFAVTRSVVGWLLCCALLLLLFASA
jgi:hypothetical protein